MKNSQPDPIDWFIAIGYVLIIVMLVVAMPAVRAWASKGWGL